MRTTPLVQWSDQAEKFDTCVRETVEQILGAKFPDETYDQACMSTKIGGLGVRRVMDHAAGAFTASWHEASRTAMEEWSRPVACGSEHQCQSVASANLDRSTLDGLIARADKRDSQRLRRLDVDHANAWISALPTTVNDKDTVMEPRVYLTCVRRSCSDVIPCSSTKSRMSNKNAWRRNEIFA